MSRLAFTALLVFHGLIHVIGGAAGVRLARIDVIPSMSRAEAGLWSVAGFLFVAAGIAFPRRGQSWLVAAGAAVVISQVLIARTWDAARFGTIANAVILVVMIPPLARLHPGSLSNRYRNAVSVGLLDPPPVRLVTESDLSPLPPVVQTYLRRAGAIGKPAVGNLRARFSGRIRNGFGSPWMPIRIEQHNFLEKGSRAFHLESSTFGLPIEGLHLFEGPGAVMEIRLASIVPVARGSGDEMNQSETVTIFNDMWLLAPATLLDPNIRWEVLNPSSVLAAFTRHGITIRAIVRFDQDGDLVDFESDDRYQTTGNGRYVKARWSTPVSGYRDLNGRRIWTEGRAIWETPEGPFCYGEFHLESIAYNLAPHPEGPGTLDGGGGR